MGNHHGICCDIRGVVYVPINDVEIIQFKCLFFKLCWRSPFPFLYSQNVSLWNVCLDVRLSAAPAKNGWTHLNFLSCHRCFFRRVFFLRLTSECDEKGYLGGGFKQFLLLPRRDDPIWRCAYFSDGLVQPPTSYYNHPLCLNHLLRPAKKSWKAPASWPLPSSYP